jgi:hypothetical protein
MTYLVKYDFFYFSQSLESCSSASHEAILNFSKDLQSPVHALFTIYYDKFNQVFRSKKPCSFTYGADLRWFLCVSHRSWWGGAVAIATFPSPPAAPALISLWTAHLSWLWVDLPTDLWAIQPTCHEVTDFKKAVSQRVKRRVKICNNEAMKRWTLLASLHRCQNYRYEFMPKSPYNSARVTYVRAKTTIFLAFLRKYKILLNCPDKSSLHHFLALIF